MRLPSHDFNTIELVRNMSIPVDGPEEVLTAEEYFHPPGSQEANGLHNTERYNSMLYHINGGLEVVRIKHFLHLK